MSDDPEDFGGPLTRRDWQIIAALAVLAILWFWLAPYLGINPWCCA